MDAVAIAAKIETYKKNKEEFIKSANEQIIAFNAAIQALEELLKEEAENVSIPE